MTDPDKTITPTLDSSFDGNRKSVGGLTLREHFALEFAKAMIQSNYTDSIINESIRFADILIERLNKK
jgi:hypothetical protein